MCRPSPVPPPSNSPSRNKSATAPAPSADEPIRPLQCPSIHSFWIERVAASKAQPPEQGQRQKQSDAERPHNASLKHDRGVEQHKNKKSMPDRRYQPVTLAIGIQVSPPPSDIGNPRGQKGIIDEQPAAPVHPGDVSRLPCRFAVCCGLAPMVIEMKGADRMRHQPQTPRR